MDIFTSKLPDLIIQRIRNVDNLIFKEWRSGGLMISALHRVVWVRALAWDIVLCSWARHFTLTVPLSTQVYN